MYTVGVRHVLHCVSLLLIFLLFSSQCWSSQIDWKKWVPEEDVEYGVTTILNGITAERISALESGYNGAYGIVRGVYDAWGESFYVTQDQALVGLSLRVSSFSSNPGSGSFEVAIYEFESDSNSVGQKVAAVTSKAELFDYDLAQVPVSFFDFSLFTIPLTGRHDYFIGVTVHDDFEGSLYLQAATDIYPSGSTYVGTTAIPEPSTFTFCLLGLGVLSLLGFASRRKRI